MKNQTEFPNRLRWQLFSAVLLVIVGVVLLILGTLLPPMGEIHPSILTAFGEISCFSGSLFGINVHYRIKTDQIEKEYNSKKKE